MNRLTVLNKCLITAYEWLELEERLRKSNGEMDAPKLITYRPKSVSYSFPTRMAYARTGSDGAATGMRQGELRGLSGRLSIGSRAHLRLDILGRLPEDAGRAKE